MISRGYFTGKECNPLPPSHISFPPPADSQPLSLPGCSPAEGLGATRSSQAALPRLCTQPFLPSLPHVALSGCLWSLPSCTSALGAPSYCVHGQIWAALWLCLRSRCLRSQRAAQDGCWGIWAKRSKEKKASGGLANVCVVDGPKKEQQNLQSLPMCLLLKITP